MTLKIALGFLMVILLFRTVAAKFLARTFLVRMKKTFTDTELRSIRGQLKGLEAEAGIAKRKERTLEKQVTRIETRIKNHEDELKGIQKK